MDRVALILVIVALNWLLVGLFSMTQAAILVGRMNCLAD